MQNRSLSPATLSIGVPSIPALDALEIWQVVVTGDGPTQIPDESLGAVWCAEFTVGPVAAASFLQKQERALAAARAALPAADRRLRDLAASASVTDGVALAFSPGQMPAPERELASWLNTVRAQGAAFSGELLFRDWREWEEEARRFIEQVRRSVTYAAWVETRAQGHLMACSQVSWLGDARTTSVFGLSQEWMETHRRLVALALESRAAWLHLALQVVGAAAILDVLVPSGNVLLALPAAWRFIRSIIADLGRLAALRDASDVA